MWIVDTILISFGVYLLLKLISTLGIKCLLISYFLISFAQQIASIIYLNSGVFVLELNRITYYVPESAPLYILFVDLYLLFLYFFSKRTQKQRMLQLLVRVNGLSRLFCFASLMITATFSLYVLADLLISGIPMFSSNITRYNFFSSYSRLPLASTVNNLMALCMYLIGYTYVHLPYKRIRRECILFVLLCTSIRLMLGNKMSGLIDIPLNFLAIVAMASTFQIKRIQTVFRPKYMLALGAVMIALVSMFVVSSVLNGNASSVSEAIEQLEERAFGMGNHMWWSLEADNVTGNSFFGRNLWEEISAVLTAKDQFDLHTGMYHLMRKYGNSYIVAVDIKHHVRYAASFITTSVYNWGYCFAFIPIALTAYVTIWFLNSIEAALMNDRFLQMILLCKIWGTFSTFIVGSGTATEWLNPENYMYFILYFLTFYYGRDHRMDL